VPFTLTLIYKARLRARLLGRSLYRAGRSAHWLKIKNPAAPAVKREADEDGQ
jgi:hypothetical protein